MIVLAVAERAHVPGMSAAAEARYARGWVPWAKRALEWPSATKTRWSAMGGDRVSYTINLLPPCGRPGEWDPVLARAMAMATLHWATLQQGTFGSVEQAQLVLLGRRVERAFNYDRAPWGKPYEVPFHDEVDDWYGDVRCMTLPHPSGRNRVLNDAAERERLRRALGRFCAEVK